MQTPNLNTIPKTFVMDNHDDYMSVLSSLVYLMDYDESHVYSLDLMFDTVEDRLCDVMDKLDEEQSMHPMISKLCDIVRLIEVIHKLLPHDLFYNIDTLVYLLHKKNQNS